MVLGCMLLVTQTWLAISAANSLRRLLLPNLDSCESALALVLGFLAVIQVAILGCGLTGNLHVWGVLATVAILDCVLRGCVYFLSRHDKADEISGEGISATEQRLLHWPELPRRLLGGLPQGVLVASALYWCCRHGFGPTRLAWDDYAYHLTYPYLWLTQARMTSEPLAFQSAFPFGAELLAVWWMLPFRLASQPDVLAWVSLTGPIYGLLCGLATAAILRSLGCSAAAAIVPMNLVLTSRTILWEIDQFADVDFALPVLIVAAIPFVLRLNDAHDPRLFFGRLSYAAMGSGLALGTKFTALISCLILLIVIVQRAGAGRRWNRIPGSLAVVCGAWIVLGGYWYLRNWLVYGNPVWPARLLFFPGVESIYQTSTLREYASRFGLAKAMADALAVYLDWPWDYAVFACVGFVGVPVLAVASRSPMAGPLRTWTGLCWGILALTLALLPGQPYSAGHAFTFETETVHATTMRFITLLPILGWISVGATLEIALSRNRRVILSAVISVYALSQLCLNAHDAKWTAALIGITLGLALFSSLRRSRRVNWNPGRLLVQLGICAGCLALLLAWHPYKREMTRGSLTRPFDRDVHSEWACLNEFSAGRTAGHSAVYILFGERFQFSPLIRGDVLNPVDATHFVSSIPAWDGLPAAEIERLLRDAQIDFFVTTRYEMHDRRFESPLETRFAESGEFVPVCRGESMTVWRARSAAAAPGGSDRGKSARPPDAQP